MQNPEVETRGEAYEPASVRFLRRLVTALALVMVAGVLTIIVLLVMRFRDVPPGLPEEISLPAGASATGFSQGDQWFAVTTDQNEILIFDRITGALRQTVKIKTND